MFFVLMCSYFIVTFKHTTLVCLLLISHEMYIKKIQSIKNKNSFWGEGGGSPIFKSIKGLDDQGLPELLSFYT